MGKLIGIFAMLCVAVYLGTHPGVVRWGYNTATAPLHSWIDNPDKQQWPSLTGNGRELEKKIKRRQNQNGLPNRDLRPGDIKGRENGAAGGSSANSQDSSGVRAVAVQSARGLQ
jgi:hypothetical protein